jgi:hypothetical protein
MAAHLVHQPHHVAGMAGQQAAHVVVDAAHMGYRRQILLQGADELGLGHVQGDAARIQGPMIHRGHGQVQDDLLVHRVGAHGQVPGMGGMGQEGAGHRCRQVHDPLAGSPVQSKIVDDDADHRQGLGRQGRAGQQQQDQQPYAGSCPSRIGTSTRGGVEALPSARHLPLDDQAAQHVECLVEMVVTLGQ